MGGQGDVGGEVGPSTVASFGSLGEGLDDGCLVVLFPLDVERQALPQVVTAGTAFRLGPGHRLPIGAGNRKWETGSAVSQAVCQSAIGN